MKDLFKNTNLVKDINMLEAIMRRNFFIKKHWRNGGGIHKVYFNKRNINDCSFID